MYRISHRCFPGPTGATGRYLGATRRAFRLFGVVELRLDNGKCPKGLPSVT